MKTFTTLFALFSAAVVAASPTARSPLVINTRAFPQCGLHNPTHSSCSVGATECQPTLLSWSGGEPAYHLAVQSTTGSHVYLSGNTYVTSLTWVVNVPAGTVVSAQLKDSAGVIAYTASFTIAKGSCKLL
jgi:hypothetical protein